MTGPAPSLRVLYIDDEEDLRVIVSELLADEGYEVDCAASAEEGLARLAERRYHLVLTDYEMPPGDNGVAMLATAKARGQLAETATCIITAHDAPGGGEAHEVLRKPVDVHVLLGKMHALLARARQEELERVRGQLEGDHREDRTTMLDGPHEIDFVLYISAASPASVKAVRNMQRLLTAYDGAKVRFRIRDLAREPLQSADEDRVAFTPTLVKRSPPPRTWIIGDLDDIEVVADMISYAGVEERK